MGGGGGEQQGRGSSSAVSRRYRFVKRCKNAPCVSPAPTPAPGRAPRTRQFSLRGHLLAQSHTLPTKHDGSLAGGYLSDCDHSPASSISKWLPLPRRPMQLHHSPAPPPPPPPPPPPGLMSPAPTRRAAATVSTSVESPACSFATPATASSTSRAARAVRRAASEARSASRARRPCEAAAALEERTRASRWVGREVCGAAGVAEGSADMGGRRGSVWIDSVSQGVCERPRGSDVCADESPKLHDRTEPVDA